MMNQRTITIRAWFVSIFVSLVLIGTGVMVALIFGIRELVVDREGRLLVRQALDHQEAALEIAIAPADSLLLTLRDWLVSDEFTGLDENQMQARVQSLLGVASQVQGVILVLGEDRLIRVLPDQSAVLPEAESWLESATAHAEAQKDGNRQGVPSIAWSLVPGSEAGERWIHGAVAIEKGEGRAAAAVYFSENVLHSSASRVRHRPEVLGFWIWEEGDEGAQTFRAARSAESGAMTRFLDTWQSTPSDTREELLAFESGGSRYHGALQRYSGHLKLPLQHGVLAPDRALLPAFRELAQSIVVVSITGLLLALCVGVLMAQRLRKPLDAATVSALRLAAGNVDPTYSPRTRLREMWLLLQGLDELHKRTASMVADQKEEAPRQNAVHSLRKWVGEDDEPALPIPEADQEEARADKVQTDKVPSKAPVMPILLPESEAPAALVQALESSRHQLRAAREELESAYAQLNAAGARDRQHRQHLERLRATVIGLSRIDTRHARQPRAKLDRLCAVVAETMGVARASLWAFDESRARLNRLGLTDRSELQADIPERLDRQSFKGFFTAIETETIILVSDTSVEHAFPALAEAVLKPAGVHAFVAVPLIALGDLAGLLLLEQGADKRTWSLEDESLMLAMGALAAPMVSLAEQDAVVTAPQDHSAAVIGAADRAIARGSGILWETDSIGCLTFIAGAVTEVYGYTTDELRGKPISLLAEGENATADLDRLMTLLAGEACVPYTCTHRRKDGTLVRLLVTAKAIRGEDGSIVGASGTAVILETVS
jgi:PAS domain S-box-containing protein